MATACVPSHRRFVTCTPLAARTRPRVVKSANPWRTKRSTAGTSSSARLFVVSLNHLEDTMDCPPMRSFQTWDQPSPGADKTRAPPASLRKRSKRTPQARATLDWPKRRLGGSKLERPPRIGWTASWSTGFVGKYLNSFYYRNIMYIRNILQRSN